MLVGKLLRNLQLFVDQRRSIRELRAIDRQSGNPSLGYLEEKITAARDNLNCGRRDLALAIVNDMRRLYPKSFMFSKPALRLLLDLHGFDEAEAMMRQGRRRYPTYADFAVGYAEVARQRGDLEEALRRCKTVRDEFPRVAAGFTIATICLDKLGRSEEADAMLAQAIRRFPDDLEVLVDHARRAMRQADWPEALRRWEAASSRFNNAVVAVNVAQCLRAMARYSDAEKVASDACARFPTVPGPLIELATIAMINGDLELASQCWKNVRRRHPFLVRGYTAGADLEKRAGREDEADAILSEGIERCRSELDIHLEYARHAQRRCDWEVAAERWALVRQRFPDCGEAQKQEIVARISAEGQKQG